MRRIIRLIIKHHFFLLFLLFEFFALYLLISNDPQKRAVYLSTSNHIAGGLYKVTHGITQYFDLKKQNEYLHSENTWLRNKLEKNRESPEFEYEIVRDTVYHQRYVYYPAEVINNTIQYPNNYLTLNKGTSQGIHPGMAVISPQGVVGIVNSASGHFATVISALNMNIKISSKIKKNNYFGSITWDNRSYQKVVLNDIPFHVNINIGDTIITSGYSAIFPEGIMIGTITGFNLQEGANFYEITVDLSTDFKNLNEVYVIADLLKYERIKLEEEE